MKNIKILSLLLGVTIAGTGLLYGCSSGGDSDSDGSGGSGGSGNSGDQEQIVEIAMEPLNHIFTAEGGTTQFNVICKGKWTIVPSDDWFSVEPQEGFGNGSVRVTANANVSEVERMAYLLAVSQSGNEAHVELFQEPAEVLSEVAVEVEWSDFSVGDAVGIFMVNHAADGASVPMPDLATNAVNNARYALTDAAVWEPYMTVYWQDSHTVADGYLYYPWGEISTNDPEAMPMAVSTDQTDPQNYQSSCILYGSVFDVEPGAPLHFVPSLLSARINAEITLTADVQNAYQIQGVTFSGLQTEGTLNFHTGSLTSAGTPADIQGYLTADQISKWHAVVAVPPQTVGQLHVIVTYKNRFTAQTLQREYVVRDLTLASNQSYGISLVLDKEKDPVEISDIQVSQWGEGGSFDLDFE